MKKSLETLEVKKLNFKHLGIIKGGESNCGTACTSSAGADQDQDGPGGSADADTGSGGGGGPVIEQQA